MTEFTAIYPLPAGRAVFYSGIDSQTSVTVGAERRAKAARVHWEGRRLTVEFLDERGAPLYTAEEWCETAPEIAWIEEENRLTARRA